MYCPKCNRYIPVDYAKCPNCGFRPAPDSVSKDDILRTGEAQGPTRMGSDSASSTDPYIVEVAGENNGNVVSETTPDADARKCPFCAETIKLDAIICRFCRMDLRTGRPVDGIAQGRAGVDNVLKYGCAVLLVLVICILLIFLLLLRGCYVNTIVKHPIVGQEVYLAQGAIYDLSQPSNLTSSVLLREKQGIKFAPENERS